MSAEPIQDVEVVPEVTGEPSTEVAIVAQGAASMIFRTDDPLEIMQRTTEVADGLKQFIGRQGLVSKISGRDYIVVEGWQMLGMMLGVTPAVVTQDVEGGIAARCELHDRSGNIVGTGDASCMEDESQGREKWGDRPYNARKSMAQTRSIAKAYRNTFGFIAKAAGFEATPAEEMPSQEARAAGPPFGPPASSKVATSLRNAIAYVLAEAPVNSEGVTALLDQIEAGAGGYLPDLVARSVGHVAAAGKAMREKPASLGDAERLANKAIQVRQGMEEPPQDDDQAADEARRIADETFGNTGAAS